MWLKVPNRYLMFVGAFQSTSCLGQNCVSRATFQADILLCEKDQEASDWIALHKNTHGNLQANKEEIRKKDNDAKSYAHLLPSPLRPDSGTDLGSNLMVTKPLGGLGERRWAKHVFRADNISNHHLTPQQRKGHIPLPFFKRWRKKREEKMFNR